MARSPVRRVLQIGVVGFIVGGASLVLSGQAPDYVRANYTKREVQIPMRHGVKLSPTVLRVEAPPPGLTDQTS